MKPKNPFKTGDLVSVVNDTLTGTVIAKNGERLTIECEEGFRYTFNAEELVYCREWSALIRPPKKDQIDDGGNAKHKAAGKTASKDAYEVDLHIHQLVDHESGMSNFDKLSLQLDTAQNALEKAIEQKQQKIIFIHGRGEGVLRKELRNLLQKYPVAFHDASYLSYGLGATEVLLFQHKK